MKLLEFEGKELFRQAGIPVPESRLVRVNDGGRMRSQEDVADDVLRAGSELIAGVDVDVDTGEGSVGNAQRAESEESAGNEGGARVVNAGRAQVEEVALVLKAQLDMGGRGKAGLIRRVPRSSFAERLRDYGGGEDAGLGDTAARQGGGAGYSGGVGAGVDLVNPVTDVGTELRSAIFGILGSGYRVPALLLERAVSFVGEFYLSISLEPSSAQYIVLASAEGGVDIEELSVHNPEAIRRVLVDPFRGLQAFQVRELGFALLGGMGFAEGGSAADSAGAVQAGFAKRFLRTFTSALEKLYQLFMQKDAELVEINPLFVTVTGDVIAGDSKVIIDDSCIQRHEEFALEREQFDSDTAFEAAQDGIPYLQFEGNISLMCAGAGLTTTVFDIVNDEGGRVANYLEFGGPNYHRAERAMELCLKNKSDDPNYVILIVTFGTIARADVMATGVVNAMQKLQPNCPIVSCIRGTNEEAADRILREAGLTPLYDMEEAVRRAVALAGQKEAQ